MIWTTFGWAGITLSIPDSWEIAGISGDQKAGYLRLDDENMPRLELKWSESKRKKNDLHAVLDEYFKLVRKSYSKKGSRKSGDLRIKRDVNLLKAEQNPHLHEPIFFQWRGDIFAHGVISHCPKSQQITIAQVMAKTHHSLHSVSVPLFLSLKNISAVEPEDDFLWSAYQMSFWAPQKYRLEKQQLLSGYLLFSFVDPGTLLDRKRRLSVERYGLADVLLKDRELEDWFRAQYQKSLRGFGYQIEVSDDGTDEQFMLLGQETRFSDNIPFQQVQSLDQLSKRKTLATHVRRCRRSNRIFVVQSVSKQNAVPVVNRVAASIHCHSDTDQEIGALNPTEESALDAIGG